ncbi:MAG: hypothetical protein HKM04_03020 [Legionellales bacterium]|nr:hypothetical protein [Legionellales bacterium]
MAIYRAYDRDHSVAMDKIIDNAPSAQANLTKAKTILPGNNQTISEKEASKFYLASLRHKGVDNFLIYQHVMLPLFARDIEKQGHITLISAGENAEKEDESVYHVANAYFPEMDSTKFLYPRHTLPKIEEMDVNSKFSQHALKTLLDGAPFYSLKWAAQSLPADNILENNKIYFFKDTAKQLLQYKFRRVDGKIKTGHILPTEIIDTYKNSVFGKIADQESLDAQYATISNILLLRGYGKELSKVRLTTEYWENDRVKAKLQDEYAKFKPLAYQAAQLEQYKDFVKNITECLRDDRPEITDEIDGWCQEIVNETLDIARESKGINYKDYDELPFSYKCSIETTIYAKMRRELGEVERKNYPADLATCYSQWQIEKMAEALGVEQEEARIAYSILADEQPQLTTLEQLNFLKGASIPIDEKNLVDFPAAYVLNAAEVTALKNRYLNFQIFQAYPNINADNLHRVFNIIGDKTIHDHHESRLFNDTFQDAFYYPNVTPPPENPNYNLTYLFERETENGEKQILEVKINVETFFRVWQESLLPLGEHDQGKKFFSHVAELFTAGKKIVGVSPNLGIEFNYPEGAELEEINIKDMNFYDDKKKYGAFYRMVGGTLIQADNIAEKKAETVGNIKQAKAYKDDLESSFKTMSAEEDHYEETQKRIKGADKYVKKSERFLTNSDEQSDWRNKNPRKSIRALFASLLPDGLSEEQKRSMLNSLNKCEKAFIDLSRAKGRFEHPDFDARAKEYINLIKKIEHTGEGFDADNFIAEHNWRVADFLRSCKESEKTITSAIKEMHTLHAKGKVRQQSQELILKRHEIQVKINELQTAMRINDSLQSYLHEDVTALLNVFVVIENEANLRINYFLPDADAEINSFLSYDNLVNYFDNIKVRTEALLADVAERKATLETYQNINVDGQVFETDIDIAGNSDRLGIKIQHRKQQLAAIPKLNEENAPEHVLPLLFKYIEEEMLQYELEYEDALRTFDTLPRYLQSHTNNVNAKANLLANYQAFKVEHHRLMNDLKPEVSTSALRDIGRDLTEARAKLAWERIHNQSWYHLGEKSADNEVLSVNDKIIFTTGNKRSGQEKLLDAAALTARPVGPFINYQRAIKALQKVIDKKKDGPEKEALTAAKNDIDNDYQAIIVLGKGNFAYNPVPEVNALITRCKNLAHPPLSKKAKVGLAVAGVGAVVTTGAGAAGAAVVATGLLSTFWQTVGLGAATGATLGTGVCPVVATIVGGLVGAAVGAGVYTLGAAAVGVTLFAVKKLNDHRIQRNEQQQLEEHLDTGRPHDLK